MRACHDTETLWGVVPLPQLWIVWLTGNTKERDVLAQEIVGIFENLLVQYHRPSPRSRPVCGNN